MSGRPWYKRYGADFVHGCLGLTLEEKGAYSLCLDLIYDRGGPIPDDARWLAGVCGVSLRKWTALRARLIDVGKLIAADGRLSNRRAEKEIENASKTAQKHAESGSNGGRKRAENEAYRRQNNTLDEAILKHRERDQKPEARSQSSDADASDARSDDAPIPPPLGGMTRRETISSDRQAFDQFWQLYPHKVGKQDAAKAFAAAMKRGGVTLDVMLAALDRYIRTKPPDRAWCNPGTWLRQGRWEDDPGPDPTSQRGPARGPSGASQRIAAMAEILAERRECGFPAEDPGGIRPHGEPAPDSDGDVLPFGGPFASGVR